MQIVLHERITDYSPEEAMILSQAFSELEAKAQEGNLSLEETRIRVAYCRYKREEDFKIAILPTKKVKEPKAVKEPKEPKERKPRKSTKVPEQISSIQKASQILYKRKQGIELTEDEEDFLESMMGEPPTL